MAGLLVLDFESAAVEDLVHGSRWTLVLGVAAALLLTAVALVLWRQALEREQGQAVLAQQKRLSALGEMAAVMAHEIRNPLASLKGNAEVLAELAAGPAPPSEALARKAGWIVKEAARLSALLDDLLDFSRSGPPELRSIAVADLLAAAAREVDDPRVRVDASAAGASWSVDPVRLHQLLTNLLRNALAASPADGAVELTATASPSRLLISVRDHGDGLPAGAETRIFEPFFTTRSQGTGLGLAVSRRIAELHGGALVARNHPGGGAELRLTLPAAATAERPR